MILIPDVDASFVAKKVKEGVRNLKKKKVGMLLILKEERKK